MAIHHVTIDQLLEQGIHLFAPAAEETGCHGQVNWEALRATEAAGQLILFAVSENMLMVGYGCAAVSPEFWDDQTSCTLLSAFVSRRTRGRWGAKLLWEIAAEGRRRGATLFRVPAVAGSRFTRMLAKTGFQHTAEVFETDIDGFLAGR